MLSIQDMATFCKKKGFVYPSSEIYGGLSGFFEFGPLGVELKNKIFQNWWKYFVQDRPDVVGIEGSIILNPKTWQASGHLDGFSDVIIRCTKCKNSLRADHFVEDKLDVQNAENLSGEKINKLIVDNGLKCPACGGCFEELNDFNLMFKTEVGAVGAMLSYLRPENAQNIFTNFKNVVDTSRVKLPFGIAMVGKNFRNEIAPRDFLFRLREFHIAELEFFTRPNQNSCNLIDDTHKNLEVPFVSAEIQEKGKKNSSSITIRSLIDKKKLTEWHAYWLAEQFFWFYNLGLSKKKLRLREHVKNELSHYSSATLDIEYEFPFGFKEVSGIANRGQFDLKQHQFFSKKSLEYFDEENKAKFIPSVIEPTFGMERVILAVLFNSYVDDENRGKVVLKFPPRLAPVLLAVFPLVKNNEDIVVLAKKIFNDLRTCYSSQYDGSGSVGRRYARADEIGVPYCITVDYESLVDNKVTVRFRDSTEQTRVKIDGLKDFIWKSYIDNGG